MAKQMMMSGKKNESLPKPVLKGKATRAEPADGEKAFNLFNIPREGIPLRNAGRETDVVVHKVLFKSQDHKIYEWAQIKEKGANFTPPLKDVCRVVVFCKSLKSYHFMLCVQTLSNPKKPYTGELYHPLNLRYEMELLQQRKFNNAFRFTSDAHALERIPAYNNRLPGHPLLAEEGFISDHIAVRKYPDHFNSHECFVQQDELLFEEKALYCPSDKIKQLDPKTGEQVAFEELAPDQEGEEVGDEPAAAAEGEEEGGTWVERPKKKQAPPQKKKAPAGAKKKSRELAEDPVEDDQGDSPKVSLTPKKLKVMTKTSNPAPEAAEATPVPKGAIKRPVKNVPRQGKSYLEFMA